MKKILFALIFLLFLFGFWQSCQAVDLLIDKYPDVSGADTPSKENTDLPNLINYIYRFALLACGIVAFVSILIGAVRYIFSAGNATIAGDAKDQITQALLGVLILLASVLILRTINPDLVNLNLNLQTSGTGDQTSGAGGQTGNYACYCLSSGGNTLFAGSCYNIKDNCVSSCAAICGNADKVGFCKKDADNCP